MHKFKTALNRIRRQRGFTLVELMVAVLISFIILAAIFEFFIAQRKRYVTEDAMLEVENRGDFAIEYLTRTIENSGYNIKQGMKFETASDHYFTTAMDQNDDGDITADELVTIALNKSTRDVSSTLQPTELVRDVGLDDFTGGKRWFGFDAYFDMDGDGNVDDAEKFTSGYNLNTARSDSSLDQKDAIRLYLTGPPYALYRYSYALLDTSAAYNAATNPYIVNPQPDLIADNVDNFAIRYYDEQNLPLPVTKDTSGNRITPNPPYVLSRDEMTHIRRVEFEVLMKSARKDAKWTDTGSYPGGSVATYDTNGKPYGWACGDATFRAGAPYLTNCAGLSDWDCFIRYCANKTYPTLTNAKKPYSDNYRRLLLTSSVSPKNLVLNPYGALTLTVDPTKVRCPDTYATLTATLKDVEGNPITAAVVNFYSTSLVSTLDFSGVSATDGSGNPITDANGVVTGIKLKAIPLADGTKKPVTVTVSADSSITVTVSGVARSFPIYSSVIVPFVVGPPTSVELKNPPTDTVACTKSDSKVKPFVVYAHDCNDFAVEGATITITPFNPTSPGTPIASNIDPGLFYKKNAGRVAGDEIHSMVDYSDNADDDGKYVAHYEPPNPTGTDTYLSSLGLTFEAVSFESKTLTGSAPTGWGFSSDPLASCYITITPGGIKKIDVTPTTYSGSGCQDEYFSIYATGNDCGSHNTYNVNSMWASILGSPITGVLQNLLGTSLGTTNAKMVWDSDRQKYRLIFVNTGCATTPVTDEKVQVLNYDPTDTTYPVPVADWIDPSRDPKPETTLNLAQCPTGINITLRARQPYLGTGAGTLTDGFYQDGCNYNNLDVIASVTLNIPPSTLCNDLPSLPVTFSLVSGGARFLDASNNPTLTTKTVNTNSVGDAIVGMKLTGTSLADVVIEATSTYGTSPVYTDTSTLNLTVGDKIIVYAYRDSCYNDLLSPANGLRTDDYMYLEVRDCNRNTSITAADTTTATVYEFLSAIGDSETVTLTETGVTTGIFRGKIKTRSLPPGWTSTSNDGVLDIVNGSSVNVKYQDDALNDYYAYTTSNIPTILDQCNEGIRFVENFANATYDGLTSYLTNFGLTGTASWRGFSSLNVTRRTTTPTITPSSSTFKYLLLQFCDEMFLSGSVYAQYFYNGSVVSFPPSTTPAVKWRSVENLMWVDLDESVVGTAASEANWGDLAVTYRFKYMGSPADSGYGSTTATIPDYYLPGVDKGVFFLFRTASSNVTMTGLTGTPTMDIVDRGYIAVWTKDSSGNPLAKLFRVDGVDVDANPITVDVVQMGGDVTGTDFNISYDSPGYHKAEIVLDGNDFYVYFDDVLLDFDGQSGPSAIGGASVIDKNYTTGSIGFGVKDIIAKFDNIQVCGCAPMKITTSNASFPTGTPVTLHDKDTIYNLDATGPVTWTVTPSGTGSFSDNPSTGASTIFTRAYFADFPTEFDAIDALGCVATFLTAVPAATCVTQTFETYTDGATPTDFTSWVGTWYVKKDSSNGNSLGIYYNGTVSTTVRLIRATATAYQAIWSNSSSDLYDDYTAEVYVRPYSVSSSSGTYAALIFRNLTSSTAGYYLMISRASSGKTLVTLKYDPTMTTNNSSDEATLATVTTTNTYSTSTIYHLWVQVNGSDIDYKMDVGGTVYASGTVSDSRCKTGGPGFRLYNNNAYFDNFKICTLP